MIVSSPSEKMIEHYAVIDDGKKGIEIRVMANIKKDELFPVVQNWLARVKYPLVEFVTPQSLVDYINSKSAYGFKAELP